MKKLNVFLIMMLLIGQTILGPIGAASASGIDGLADAAVAADGGGSGTEVGTDSGPEEGGGSGSGDVDKSADDSSESSDGINSSEGSNNGSGGNDVTSDNESTGESTEESDGTSNGESTGNNDTTSNDGLTDEATGANGGSTGESTENNDSTPGESDEANNSDKAPNVNANEEDKGPDEESFNVDPVIEENIITSVKMFADEDQTPIGRPGPNDTVFLEFEWELKAPHNYGEGSTFTFQLPAGITLGGPSDGTLNEFATYTISSSGEVVFTFNEHLSPNKPVTGGLKAWRQFDKSSISGGLDQEFEFIAKGEVIVKIPIHFEVINNEMTKTGTANKGKNPSYIDWVVDFNKGEETINNAKFTDELPDALAVDGKIEVYKVKFDFDGNEVSGSEEHLKDVTSFDDVVSGTIDKAYRVKYSTKIDIDKIENTNGVTLTNNAKLQGNGNNELQKSSKGVYVSYSQPLGKRAGNYDSSEQTIEWEIEYNYNEQKISNASFTDKFSDSHELVENSFIVYPVTITDGGSAQTGTAIPSDEYDVTYTPGADNFTLQFKNEIENAYKIVYKTKSKDRVYVDSATIENTVTADIADEPKTATKDIEQVIFNKSDGRINNNNKTIDWTIELNKDKQTMTNVVIEDTYTPAGLTLVPNTVTITGLIKETDYQVEEIDSWSEGFKIIFLKPIDSAHTITYTTSYDSTSVPVNGYTNTAILDWKERNDDNQSKITKTGTAKPNQQTKDNGRKIGSYNAKDKVIDWTIDVNYNYHEVQEMIIEDYYSNGQKLVEDSLKVYQLEIPAGGGVPTPTGQTGFTDFQRDTSVTKGDKDGFKLTLNTNKDKKAYRVTYQTTLDGEQIEGTYSNNAVMYDSNAPTAILFDKSATVTPTHGGEYIEKKGSQIEQYSDIAKWAVVINRSQSQIDAKTSITDTLSGDQILLPDTIKLYEVNVPANNNSYANITTGTGRNTGINVGNKGNEIKTGFDLKVEGNTFTLTFNEPLTTAYILEYESFINRGNGEISNKAQFGTHQAGDASNNWEVEANVAFLGSSGWASSPSKIKFKKVDADTAELLPGATFELYDKSGDVLLEKVTTGADGTIETSLSYKYDSTNGVEYQLKEIASPDGYVPGEYATKKVVKFYGNDNEIVIENKQLKDGFEFTKVDETDPTKGLAGAEFELRKQGDPAVIATITSDANGKVSYGGLATGNYELIETKAPVGYELDQTPHTFEIVANQTEPTQVGTNGQVTNAKGSGAKIIVTKVDTDDNSVLLDGAEFEVVNSDGDVVATETTVGGKVEFTNLDYGEYTVREIKAPENYVDASLVADQEVLVDKAEVEVTFENKKTDRSVKLTKTAQNNASLLLQGAEFKLMKEGPFEFEEVSSGHTTDTNGEIYLDELEAGNYQLIETKAPSGYRLDATPVEFEITENQTETKLVMKENRRRSSGGGGGTPPIPPKTCDVFTLTVKEDGKALEADAEFTLRSETKEVSGKTDANGKITFEKDDLPEGTYSVYDGDNDRVGSVTVKYTEADCQAEIDMNPKVCEVFTVTVKEEGKTVGSNVELKLKSATTDIFGKTDANGKIVFDKENLPAGTYTAYDKNGKDVGTVTVTYDYNDCQAEVDLNPIAPKACEVFTVTVKEQGKTLGSHIELTLKSGTTEVVGKTDANGKIIFDKEDLPEGTYTAYDKNGEEVGTITVTYTEGKCAAEIDLNPKACETFTLTVKDTPNADVMLKDKNGNTVATGKTDVNGKVVFDKPILEGNYEVYVQGKNVGSITVTDSCIATINPKVPEEPVDPENPNKPSKPGDGKDPNQPDGPGTEVETPNTPGGPGAGGNDLNAPGGGSGDPKQPGTSSGSTDPNQSVDSTNKLPQTGEEHFIYMIAFGILFLAAGGTMLFRQRKKA